MTDGDGEATKALAPPEILKASVQVSEGGINAPILLRFAGIADEIAKWWSPQRDTELREFWKTEPLLASAIYTVMSRQAALDWTLDGPPKAVKRAHDILTHADLGQGWISFIEKGTEDLCTQDNGWFIELIRPKGAGPEVAPIGIAHLDAGACMRTGDAEIPVIYTDKKGLKHLLKWWQVIILAEMPSPIQTMNGVGFCAVSRVLKAAQILRDIGTYKKEKVSSKPQRGLWFVQGIRQSVIVDALKEAEEEEANKALTRFVMPKIIASLDPGQPLNVHQLDFASLPDGFDEETTLRWYIAQLAMGFGTDYQEFAPMPGQKLGTGAQAEVMAQKARGKAPAVFRKRLEFALNQYILPQSVNFKITVSDAEEERENAQVARLRAEERKIRIDSGEINIAEARQLALDVGDLPPEMMERDITEETQARDTEGVADETRRPKEGIEEPPPEEGGEEAAATAKKGADAITGRLTSALAEFLRGVGKRLSGALWKEYKEAKKQASILDDEALWQEIAGDGYGIVFKFIDQAATEALEEAEEALLKIGMTIDYDLVNPLIKDAVASNAFDMIQIGGDRSFIESTRAQLRDLFQKYLGMPEISQQDFMASLEYLFGSVRAEMIAGTEITRIYADATLLIAQTAPIPVMYGVSTANDQDVCAICREAEAGGPYPLEDLSHKPPLHPNCRCDVVVVEAKT